MKKIFSLFFAAIVALVMVSCGPSLNADVKAIQAAVEAGDMAKLQECVDKIAEPAKLNALEEFTYANALMILSGQITEPQKGVEAYTKVLKHIESAFAKDKAAIDKQLAKEGADFTADAILEVCKNSLATWEAAAKSMEEAQLEQPADTTATEEGAEATEATQE